MIKGFSALRMASNVAKKNMSTKVITVHLLMGIMMQAKLIIRNYEVLIGFCLSNDYF